MSLAISPTTADVNAGSTRTFVGSGGTGPYIYALVSGIGSIDPDTGVYTAPAASGKAVVSVTDSALVPATETAQVTVNTALTHFCDIIQHEMGLSDGQVYLWDQKINIPTDQRLYIAIGVLTCKPFANSRTYDGSGGGLEEILSTNFMATLSVNILSRGTDARDRKEEVVLALNSTYSQQVQEANGFGVAVLPSTFVNISEIDGPAIPYRFNLSVAIQYKVTKTKAVQYYDSFTDEVLTDP